MNKSTKSYNCILCILFVLCSIQVSGQKKNVAEEYNVDSTLYAYFLRCKAELASPEIKLMTDTLFQMAEKKGDLRMQAVALSTLLDHYYFGNFGEDSLQYYGNRVKEFAKSTNQPKYYYFVWGQRLITYYIKKKQYNTALLEAEKMMKEAEQEKYPAGIAVGYNIISGIYQTKYLYELAIEYKKKEIEINLKYKTDTYNLSNLYSTLCGLYCALDQTDKAKECLQEAQKHIHSLAHEFSIYLRYAQYYQRKKEFSKAKENLQKAKRLLDKEKELSRFAYEYYSNKKSFYITTKQYAEALSVHEFIAKQYPSNATSAEYLHSAARIYEGMGCLPQALKYYKDYIQQNDSINRINEDITSSEFAAILGVERLNTEKNELLQEVQQRDLTNKTRIIFFLAALLVLGFIIIYREYLLNGRLRLSEKQLSAKNKELLASESQLLVAKEQAENASLMKSEFIQSMSHEIRTPLNSIVGFSQIISSISTDDEETKEYASIIEKGSNNLLLLVEDVLDLASLDSGTEIPTDDIANITTVCQECMMQAKSYCQPGVELLLEAEAEEFYMQTNTKRLFQIIFHLLRNAGKFTPEGYIQLKWKLDNEHKLIIFSITDTGIGIPADKQNYIFERFTKIDSFAQGTGLGLPISRLCAEKMGGTLTVDPNYKDGSRFILTLPQKV